MNDEGAAATDGEATMGTQPIHLVVQFGFEPSLVVAVSGCDQGGMF